MNHIKASLFRLIPLIKVITFGVLFGLMHILLIAPFIVSETLTDTDFEREDDTFRIIMLSISFLAFLLSILIANRLSKGWKPSLSTMGITRPIAKNTITGILIGGGLITLCFLAIISLGKGHVVFSSFSTSNLAISLLIFMLVSLSEELLSRGYLLPYLRKHYGIIWAIVISSLIFTAMHLGNSHLSIVGLLSIFLAGVFMAQLRLAYSNLWVPIGMHFIWNYLQGPIYGFSVSGNATDSVFISTFDAPSLINGGDFGIEGSIITVFILCGAILMLEYLNKEKSTPAIGLSTKKNEVGGASYAA